MRFGAAATSCAHAHPELEVAASRVLGRALSAGRGPEGHLHGRRSAGQPHLSEPRSSHRGEHLSQGCTKHPSFQCSKTPSTDRREEPLRVLAHRPDRLTQSSQGQDGSPDTSLLSSLLHSEPMAGARPSLCQSPEQRKEPGDVLGFCSPCNPRAHPAHHHDPASWLLPVWVTPPLALTSTAGLPPPRRAEHTRCSLLHGGCRSSLRSLGDRLGSVGLLSPLWQPLAFEWLFPNLPHSSIPCHQLSPRETWTCLSRKAGRYSGC